MKKLFTSFVLLFLLSSTLMAVPAKRTPKTFTQPDGTTVTVILQGDEHFHYYSTTDGVMVKKDSKGYMRYAVTNSDGNFVPGEYVAKNPAQRNEAERSYILKNKEQVKEKSQVIRRKSPLMRNAAAKIGATNFPNRGEIRGLIILAQFKDKAFSKAGTQAEFANMMNEEGYSTNEATGSARDYFMAQSLGEFLPTFDVVGPVTLPQNMAYYGGNDADDQDQNPGQMVVDACNLAKSQYGTDFSQYDLDGDGKVDLVYILYAGYGEAQGGSEDTIWPHAWDLVSARKSLTLDGKKIVSYACSCELYGASGTTLDGIGTFCHEFSHCLGLPDMYDVDYSGNFGMGEWDLMDGGSYNNQAKTPAGYSAFERSSVGWITLDELTNPQDGLELEALNTSNKAYVIKSSTNSDEYFVLENRQLTGWDEYLPNHGLLITHIDYKQSAWDNNSVNDIVGHQRVIIVPADNKLLTYNGNNDDAYWASLEGDVYPGTSGNNSFTDSSVPAATLYQGGKLGKPVTNIKEENGIVTFNFMEEMLKTPVAKEASNLTNTSFIANWEALAEAESYTLSVVKKKGASAEGDVVLEEDFSKITDALKNTDISESLDDYTNEPGWEGKIIYGGDNMCRIGTSKNEGYLLSPYYDFSSGDITVALHAKKYSSSDAVPTLWVSLVNDGDDYTIDGGSSEMSDDMLLYYIVLSGGSNISYVQLDTEGNKPRVFVDDVTIYAGDVSEQLDSQNAKRISSDKNTKNKVVSQKQRKISNALYAKAANNNALTFTTTSTSYEVTGLEENATYTYSVKAHQGERESAYSDAVTVDLSAATGISCKPIELYNSISTNGNQLFVSSEQGKIIDIYSIDGVLRQSVTAQEGENQFSLANGIYIVRVGNASAKVVISAQ